MQIRTQIMAAIGIIGVIGVVNSGHHAFEISEAISAAERNAQINVLAIALWLRPVLGQWNGAQRQESSATAVPLRPIRRKGFRQIGQQETTPSTTYNP